MTFVSVRHVIGKQQFEHVYQPLWDLMNWSIFGYESLLRVNGVKNIEHLFQKARDEGCLHELDLASLEGSISQFPFWERKRGLLFVNLYPSTMLHRGFAQLLKKLVERFPHIENRIVFELNETEEGDDLWKDGKLNATVKLIREYGFYIAIDDVGKGASTLQKIIELQPDYVKLDRYFAQGLAADVEKQKMVSLLVNYCSPKMVLVLEGIEKETDLAQAKLLRVPAAQGYLLGKPDRLT
ncbi:diguanylate phosphodiesterase [Geobacillus subterraneus]|uniref:Diguanylate phosphodiesterase n=2 Tax=Geobacillus TaxID=129337 RepID=A0ABN4NG58_9BACL|nr:MULTISPECIES: EAL domain-containing protein [Geobacillus]AMX83625.1 diguanylate phosphodiesterase [Geobacillus subterraneus]KZS24537.1 diguanylate phosphodiesterase [Geobacillus subterraneus]OXB87843.1 EAL domain-containing protein [Geobacillus uzenensis]QIZ67768.1 EAL domain-containing protein [Geobacillus subterraneus]